MSTYPIYLVNGTGTRTSVFIAWLSSVNATTSNGGRFEATLDSGQTIQLYYATAANTNVIQIVGYDIGAQQYNMFNFISMANLNSAVYINLYATNSSGDPQTPIDAVSNTMAYIIYKNIGDNVVNAVNGVCSSGTILLGAGPDPDIICVNNANIFNTPPPAPPPDNVSNNTIIWIIVIIVIIGIILAGIFAFIMINKNKKKKEAAETAKATSSTVTI